MASNSVRRVTLTGTRLGRHTLAPTCRQFSRPQSLRYASDTAASATETAKATESAAKETAKEAPKKAGRGSRRTVLGTSLALTLLVGYVYGTDTRASVHRYAVVPLIRALYPDAEDAHHLGVDALRTLYNYGLHPRERGDPDGDGALETEVGESILDFIEIVECAYGDRSLGTHCPTPSASQADSTSTLRSLIRSSHSVLPSLKSEEPPPSHKTATPAHESSASPPRKP